MNLYYLSTNEASKQIVRCRDDATMRRAMYRYIRMKRSQGYSLASIMFCWSPVHISTTITDNSYPLPTPASEKAA